MPSRVSPQGTRENETSTTSTSPSYQSASPGLDSEETFSEEELRNKSGTHHRESQSIAADGTGYSSSIAAEHHHCEVPTPSRSPLRSKSHRRPDSSPSQLQALEGQPSPPAASYFARQPGASGFDARSPFTRRAPASRSSHGIETLSGPPPALSTQRSYTVDSPWKHPPSADPKQPSHQAHSNRFAPADRDTTKSTAQDYREDVKPVNSDEHETRMPTPKRANGEQYVEDEQDQVTLRGTEFAQHDRLKDRGQTGDEGLEKQSQSSHEDLFLNLAQADAAADGDLDNSHQKQRRRPRHSNSSPQPPVSYRPSSSRQSELGGRDTHNQRPWSNREHDSPSWQILQPSGGSSCSGINGSKERSYAASTHALDRRVRASNPKLAPRASLNASRARRSSTRETSPELPAFNAGRRKSVEPSPDPPTSSIRQSNHLYTRPDQYNSSPLNGYSFLGQRQGRRMSRADGTESTLSTNAPSLILEQLDDLNARIKKLELNGKMPSTSSAAMSSVLGDRSATATTSMTTMSPSPKHGLVRSDSPEASTIRGPVDTDIHPLLHSALAKSKELVSPEVFRALEATASDALTLAAMTSGTNSEAGSDSADNALKGIDRRLCHKANDMCRSLTELCIAVSDIKKDTQGSSRRSRPQSRDTGTAIVPSKPLAIEQARPVRAASLEPEARTSSRVMSRLEARRTSQVALNAQLGRRGSTSFDTPTSALPGPSVTASRASSVVLGGRAAESEFPHSRALAASEIPQPHYRPSPQERPPREYTSQHPLPTYPQQSPSVHSSLPQRKSYFLNNNTSSPITPSYPPQDKRQFDRSTPPSSGASRLAEARQRREASQRVNGELGGATRAGLLNIRVGASDIRRGP